MSSWFSYIRNSIIGDEEVPSTSATGADHVVELEEGGTIVDTLSKGERCVDQFSPVDSLPHVDHSWACSKTEEHTKVNDEEVQKRHQQQSSNSLPQLSQEQREHIKNVLRRAERSGRNAKVVVDSRHLMKRGAGGGRGFDTTAPAQKEQRQHEKEGEEEDDECGDGAQFLVQMDSLPEDVEVSVGPYSYCSYASSELSYSEADKGYSSAVTEDPPTEGALPTQPPVGTAAAVNNDVAAEEEAGVAAEGDDGRKTIAQKMQKLSQKIDQWLQSLDKEDSELEEMMLTKMDPKKGTEENNAYATTTTTAAEQQEQQSILLDYLDTLSQSICVLAIEQSANKLVAHYFELVNKFANVLAHDVIASVLQLAEDATTIELQQQQPSSNVAVVIVVDEVQAVEDVHSVEEEGQNVQEMDAMPQSKKKQISADEDEESDNSCYTILVEQNERRTTEKACDDLLPPQITTMAAPTSAEIFDGIDTNKDAVAAVHYYSGADSDSIGSGSTSGADSEASEAETLAPKNEIYGIVPKEDTMIDKMPKNDEQKDNSSSSSPTTTGADTDPETEEDLSSVGEDQRLDALSKEQQHLDKMASKMDILPNEHRFLDSVPEDDSDRAASASSPTTGADSNPGTVHDLSPTEDQLKLHDDKVAQKRDILPNEYRFLDILQKKDSDETSSASSPTTGADSNPETEQDLTSSEHQSETEHHCDKVAPKDEQKMDILLNEDQFLDIVPKDDEGKVCSPEGQQEMDDHHSTSTSGADSFENGIEFDANISQQFEPKMPDTDQQRSLAKISHDQEVKQIVQETENNFDWITKIVEDNSSDQKSTKWQNDEQNSEEMSTKEKDEKFSCKREVSKSLGSRTSTVTSGADMTTDVSSPEIEGTELTEEELAHIQAVQRMAEEQWHQKLEMSQVEAVQGITAEQLHLTEEELAHIETVQRMADEQWHPKLEMSQVEAVQGITAEQPHLTEEELAHIETVQRMADEQWHPKPVHEEVAQTEEVHGITATEQPQLIEEELAHIETVQRMADEQWHPKLEMSQVEAVQGITAEQPHLTEEELAHIETVQRMADEQWHPKPVHEEVAQTEEVHGITATEQPQLIEEELAHIETVQRMADEQWHPKLVHEEMAPIEEIQGVEEEQWYQKPALAHIQAVQRMADEQWHPKLVHEEMAPIEEIQGVEEEQWHQKPALAHIQAVQRMAEEQWQKKSIEEGMAQIEEVNGATEQPQLTEEELAHIQAVQRMADEQWHPKLVHEEMAPIEETQGVEEEQWHQKPVHEEMAQVEAVQGITADQPQVTEEELAHIQTVQRMADEQWHPKLEMAQVEAVQGITAEPPQLTEDELTHIRTVQRMADEQWHPKLVHEEMAPIEAVQGITAEPPQVTEDELTHIQTVQRMTDEQWHPKLEMSQVEAVQDITVEQPQLTDEELAHIETVQRMADEQWHPKPVHEEVAQNEEVHGITATEQPQLIEEELAHIETVQRMADEQWHPKLVHEEMAPIEAVQGITAEPPQQTEDELTHIQTVQRMADEQWHPKLEMAQVEAVQGITAEPPQLTEDELAQIERIKMLAEQCSFDMAMKSLPHQKTNVFEEDENAIEDEAQIDEQLNSSATTSCADSISTSSSGLGEVAVIYQTEKIVPKTEAEWNVPASCNREEVHQAELLPDVIPSQLDEAELLPDAIPCQPEIVPKAEAEWNVPASWNQEEDTRSIHQAESFPDAIPSQLDEAELLPDAIPCQPEIVPKAESEWNVPASWNQEEDTRIIHQAELLPDAIPSQLDEAELLPDAIPSQLDEAELLPDAILCQPEIVPKAEAEWNVPASWNQEEHTRSIHQAELLPDAIPSQLDEAELLPDAILCQPEIVPKAEAEWNVPASWNQEEDTQSIHQAELLPDAIPCQPEIVPKAEVELNVSPFENMCQHNVEGDGMPYDLYPLPQSQKSGSSSSSSALTSLADSVHSSINNSCPNVAEPASSNEEASVDDTLETSSADSRKSSVELLEDDDGKAEECEISVKSPHFVDKAELVDKTNKAEVIKEGIEQTKRIEHFHEHENYPTETQIDDQNTEDEAEDIFQRTVEEQQQPQLNEEKMAQIEEIQGVEEDQWHQKPVQEKITQVEAVQSITAPQPQLTEEELAHIQAVQRMADEQWHQKPVYKEIPQVGAVHGIAAEHQQLTEDELAHIQAVQRMADEQWHQKPVYKEMPQVGAVHGIAAEHEQLTEDELAHIQAVHNMASKQGLEPIKQVPFKADEHWHQKPVHEKMAQIEAIHGIVAEQPKLSEDELAHIQAVQRMADEQWHQKPVHEEMAPIEAIHGIVAEQPKLSEDELAHIQAVQRMADEQWHQKPVHVEMPQVGAVKVNAAEHEQLTEDELAHIQAVHNMASKQGLEPIKQVPFKADEHWHQKPVHEEMTPIEAIHGIVAEQPQLTEDELAHIQAVQRMADEQWYQKPVHEEMAHIQAVPEKPQLTEDELAQIERIKMLAEQCSFDMAMKSLPHQKTNVFEEDENAIEDEAETKEQSLVEQLQEFTALENEKLEVHVNEAAESAASSSTSQADSNPSPLGSLTDLQLYTDCAVDVEQQQQKQQQMAEQEMKPTLSASSASVSTSGADSTHSSAERSELYGRSTPLLLLSADDDDIEPLDVAVHQRQQSSKVDEQQLWLQDAAFSGKIMDDDGRESVEISTKTEVRVPFLEEELAQAKPCESEEKLWMAEEIVDQNMALSSAIQSMPTTTNSWHANGSKPRQMSLTTFATTAPNSAATTSSSRCSVMQLSNHRQQRWLSLGGAAASADMDNYFGDNNGTSDRLNAIGTAETKADKREQFMRRDNNDSRSSTSSLNIVFTDHRLRASFCVDELDDEQQQQQLGMDAVAKMDGMDDVADMDAVAKMNGMDDVADMDAVAKTDGMDDVADMDAVAKIDGMDAIAKMDGMDAVAKMDGMDAVAKDGMDDVAKMDGMDAVAKDGMDDVADMDAVAKMDGMDAVAKDGMDDVAKMDGMGDVADMDAVAKMDSMDAVAKMGGMIMDNSSLSNHGIDEEAFESMPAEEATTVPRTTTIMKVPLEMDEEQQYNNNIGSFDQQQQQMKQEDWPNNADFMCKLNFFAQRLSEEIAEEAARDITNIIHIKNNPRALYFDDKYCELMKIGNLHDQQISPDIADGGDHAEDGWSAEQQHRQQAMDEPALLYEVYDMSKENGTDGNGGGAGGGLKRELISQLNVFASGLIRRSSTTANSSSGSSRPWSATFATPFLALRATTFSSSTAGKRKGSAGGEPTAGGIMELLRRPSVGGTADECGAEELPESVLIGLSPEEREHIMRVVAESRRSTSGHVSRSSSCSLNVRPAEHVQSKPQQLMKPTEEDGTVNATTAFPLADVQQRLDQNDKIEQQSADDDEFHGKQLVQINALDNQKPDGVQAVHKDEEEYPEEESETRAEVQDVFRMEGDVENEPDILGKVQDVPRVEEYKSEIVEEVQDVPRVKGYMTESMEEVQDVLEVDGVEHDERGGKPAEVFQDLSMPESHERSEMPRQEMANLTAISDHQMPSNIAHEISKSEETGGGWLNMLTMMEKGAKQIGIHSMPTNVQASLSAKMELIKRNVDLQSLSDQFKRIRDPKEDGDEIKIDQPSLLSQNKMMVNNGNATKSPSAISFSDPSVPDFWATDIAASGADEACFDIDRRAKNAADASLSSSSGFCDAATLCEDMNDEHQTATTTLATSGDDGATRNNKNFSSTFFWHGTSEEHHGPSSSVVERTARFVSDNINMFREQLERMDDDEPLPSLANTFQEPTFEAILPPPVSAPIIFSDENEHEQQQRRRQHVEGALCSSQSVGSAAAPPPRPPPPLCTSIYAAKNGYGRPMPGAQNATGTAEEVEHFAVWKRMLMERAADERGGEHDEEEKETEERVSSRSEGRESDSEEEAARRAERERISTTMEEEDGEEEDEEEREDMKGRRRSIDWNGIKGGDEGGREEITERRSIDWNGIKGGDEGEREEITERRSIDWDGIEGEDEGGREEITEKRSIDWSGINGGDEEMDEEQEAWEETKEKRMRSIDWNGIRGGGEAGGQQAPREKFGKENSAKDAGVGVSLPSPLLPPLTLAAAPAATLALQRDADDILGYAYSAPGSGIVGISALLEGVESICSAADENGGKIVPDGEGKVGESRKSIGANGPSSGSVVHQFAVIGGCLPTSCCPSSPAAVAAAAANPFSLPQFPSPAALQEEGHQQKTKQKVPCTVDASPSPLSQQAIGKQRASAGQVEAVHVDEPNKNQQEQSLRDAQYAVGDAGGWDKEETNNYLFNANNPSNLQHHQQRHFSVSQKNESKVPTSFVDEVQQQHHPQSLTQGTAAAEGGEGIFVRPLPPPPPSRAVQQQSSASLNLGKMFFSGGGGGTQKATPTAPFATFGNKFGKMASETLMKGAKQAKEKAVTAMAQAGQTLETAMAFPAPPEEQQQQAPPPPPAQRPHSSLGFLAGAEKQNAVAVGDAAALALNKSSSFYDISTLPPGLDHLSEEEQMRIMAVMQCAELDAQLDAAAAFRQVRPAVTTKDDDDRNARKVDDAVVGIFSVMPSGTRAEKSDQLSSMPSGTRAKKFDQPSSMPSGTRTEKSDQPLSIPSGTQEGRAEQSDQSPAVVIVDRQQNLDQRGPGAEKCADIELAVEVRAEDQQDVLLDTCAANELLDLAQYGHPLGMFNNITDTDTGHLLEDQVQAAHHGQHSKKPNLPEANDDKKVGIEEDDDDELWMQPPVQKFAAPLDDWEDMPMLAATPRKQLWTTVFTEDSADQQQQQQQRTTAQHPATQTATSETAAQNEEEDELLEQISMDTVRGCWERSSTSSSSVVKDDGIVPTTAELDRRRATSRGVTMMAPDEAARGVPKQQKVEDELSKIARSIYTTDFRDDQQNYGDQTADDDYGRREKGDEADEEEALVKHRRIVAENGGHNNSYEIEMEDPWSPSLCAPPKALMLMDDNGDGAEAKMPTAAHSMPPIITVTTSADDTAEDSDYDEDDVVTTADERRRANSSSSEEEEDGDDYPDTVQPVPSVSPVTIAELQQQQEMEQQKAAAQVLQQIQAFGEAADDEFDVQWAKPKQQQQQMPTKVTVDDEHKQQQQQQRDNFFMEDQANVYSPPEAQELPLKMGGIIKGIAAVPTVADQSSRTSASGRPSSATAPQQLVATTEGGAVRQRSASGDEHPAEADQATNSSSMYRQQKQRRTNPFLINDEDNDGAGGSPMLLRDSDAADEEEEEEEEDDGADAGSGHDGGGGIVVRQVVINPLLDADDRSAEEMDRYYKTQLDQSIYFAPRPGPVYTIQETDEEAMASVPNREGIYYAERIERKPLHSDTVPSLISPEAIASTVRRKSTGANGTGRPTAILSGNVTSTFDAIVAQSPELITTTTTARSADASAAIGNLTPVRTAPPPPDAIVELEKVAQQFDQRQQSVPPPVEVPSSTIAAVLAPPSSAPAASTTTKPLNAAIHLQQQLQQLKNQQQKFATNIAQQTDLPPPQWHNAQQQPTAPHDREEGEEQNGGGATATASHRLKRSPAMILNGQCDLTSSATKMMPNGHILMGNANIECSSNQMLVDEVIDTHGGGHPSSQRHQQNILPKARKSTPSTTTTEQHQIVPSAQPVPSLVTAGAATAAVSLEMGRRRLPSLPTAAAAAGTTPAANGANYFVAKVPSTTTTVSTRLYHQCAATTASMTSSADSGGTNLATSKFSYHLSDAKTAGMTTAAVTGLITYYTSSAPEKCDAAVNGNVPSSSSSSDNASSPDSRVMFDASAVAYAQAAALGPAPWSSSSTSRTTFVGAACSASSTIMTTSISSPQTSFAANEQLLLQQHLYWPKPVEDDRPAKGPIVIPGALYHMPPSPGMPMPHSLLSTGGSRGTYVGSTSTAASYSASATGRVSSLSSSSQSVSPPRSRSRAAAALHQQLSSRSRTLERANMETHAILNFKQELRQALEKRRQALDVCDIEAGHREYVINKWLHSGIMPSRHRSSDADAVPPVTKCTLPAELLANVGRIVPPPHATAMRYGTSSLRRRTTTTPAAEVSPVQSHDAGGVHESPSSTTRTFGCQTAGSSSVHDAATATVSHLTMTPMHKGGTTAAIVCARRQTAVTDASTQTALCAETQTDPLNRMPTTEFDGAAPPATTGQQWHRRHNLLLDASPSTAAPAAVPMSQSSPVTYHRRHPQRDTYYWPHPQQQAEEDERVGGGGIVRRPTTKRHRSSRLDRFLHTDTAEWERQLRERQLQQELTIRRAAQQRHSMREKHMLDGHYAAAAAPAATVPLSYAYNDLQQAAQQRQQQQQQPLLYAQQPQQRYWTGSLPRLDDHMYNMWLSSSSRYGGEPEMAMPAGEQQLPPVTPPYCSSSSSHQLLPADPYGAAAAYYQQQQQLQQARYGYSSLPRNYERSWNAAQQQRRHFVDDDVGPLSASCRPNLDNFWDFRGPPPMAQQQLQQQPLHQQRYGSLAAGAGRYYSKSVQELDRFGRSTTAAASAEDDGTASWWGSPSQQQKWTQYGAAAGAPLSRSVNCLDRLGRADTAAAAAPGYFPSGTNEFHSGANNRRTTASNNGTLNMMAAVDDLNMGHKYGTAATSAAAAADHNALLSNYATFLNNQFMLEQQRQREMDERELSAAMGTARQPPDMVRQQMDERMVEAVLPPPVMLQHPVQLQHHAVEQQCQQMLPPPPLYHPTAAAVGPNIAAGPPPPCLYSRGLDGEHNYGVRPPQSRYEDYGNVHWHNGDAGGGAGIFRPQQQLYHGQQQDWINNNNNGTSRMAYRIEQQQHQPQVLPMPTASMVQQQQQLYSASMPMYQCQQQESRLAYPYQRQHSGAVPWPTEYQQQQRHVRHTAPSAPQGILRRPRNSPPLLFNNNNTNNNGLRDPSRTMMRSSSYGTSTNDAVSSTIKAPRVVPSSTLSEHCSRSNRTAAAGETKRILMTRHYKHENIFKDLGIRVVGGKKLPNGDLGAFITMIDSSKARETLGELREGDQILEWNGILLGGKTFEEVERLIRASNLGEIELIVRSRPNLYANGELEDEEEEENDDDDEAGGVDLCQMNGRQNGGQKQRNYGAGMATTAGAENGGGDEFVQQQQRKPSTTARKNIAFADSTKNGPSWHSPNEPPPIPAHRPQNNHHRHHQSSPTADEWAQTEIKWSNSAGGGGGGLLRKSTHGGGQMPASPPANGRRHQQQKSAGHLQVALAYDRQNWVLSIRLIAASGLATFGSQMPNPFIKVYLLPERKVSNKRRTKYVPSSCNPIWDQLVEYSIPPNQLERHYLEFTVIDYDRQTTDLDSRIIGQVHVGLADPSLLTGVPRWLALQCPTTNNSSPIDNVPTNLQLSNKTYYNPAALDLMDGYPAIA